MPVGQIISLAPPVSPDERGGSRVVTNARWDAVDEKVATDERDSSGRRRRVVLAPDAGAKLCGEICEVTVAKELGSPGRARYKPENHCAGKAGLPPLNLYARVRFFYFHFAHETAGAARIRLSLRPLVSWG